VQGRLAILTHQRGARVLTSESKYIKANFDISKIPAPEKMPSTLSEKLKMPRTIQQDGMTLNSIFKE
jgi:hypothetical protein